MKNFKIWIVAGARPNFMKIAPIVRALHDREQHGMTYGVHLSVSIVHTGQHYDDNMSEVFFRDLDIPKPDVYLGVGSGSHAEQTARIMVGFEKILVQDQPDLVVVPGDVNSTLACALTAKKLGVKVAHIEAGLRSFDMSMPEEINRKLTDAISDLLFVTEESGVRNLRVEGIEEGKIFLVGNVMIDSLRKNLRKLDEGMFVPSPLVRKFCETGRPYGLLTLHRPSNVDSPETLAGIWGAVLEIAEIAPILFLVHPRTRKKFLESGLRAGGVTFGDPIGYLDMLFAMRGAAIVLTDSGGVQEETTALGVPCVTIRENTERPSTVEVGTNHLAGTNPEAIIKVCKEILGGRGKMGRVPPLWDGKTAERISDVLMKFAAVEGI